MMKSSHVKERMRMAVLLVFCALALPGCNLVSEKLDPGSKEEPGKVVVEVPDPNNPKTPNDGPIEWTPGTSGYYLIELWGASGWNPASDPLNQYGGKGAYVCGILELTPEEVEEGKTVAVEIAHVATSTSNGRGGSGGGGSNDSHVPHDPWSATGVEEGGGGGSSDVRWGGDTLYDRILVAAGGGGANDTSKVNEPGVAPATYGVSYLPPFWKGGPGGTFNGGNSDSQTAPGLGASQTAGGAGGILNSQPGTFGLGGSYVGVAESSGGGGGGYWGGGSGGQRYFNGGGGGGSSFISGYPGCVAITGLNNTAPRSGEEGSVEKATHYSGKVFIQTLDIMGKTYTSEMIAGNEEMPAPKGGTETGHSGDGAVKITYLGEN
jgi:hypothetical protein